MRRYPLSAVIAAFFFQVVFCANAMAAPWEFHGGFYTSYEYTDNYPGTAHNEESDSIYEIGPSASLNYNNGTTRLDLGGHLARSFHRKFDDNNFNEVVFDSRLATSTRRDTLGADYSYTQSDRRDDITDVRGKSQIHTGAVNYSRALTQTTTAGLTYTYIQEENPFPYQDIISHGIATNMSHQLSQLSTVRGTVGYDTHRYEIEEDAQVLRSALGYTYQVTRLASIGTDLEYEHETRNDSPDNDTYSAFLTFGYSLTQSTHVSLSGGYNWLSIEGMDKEGTFASRGEITTRTLNDIFSLRVSREYLAEFTVDRYGTYDARSVYGSWDRTLLRDLRLLSTITYEERKPVSPAAPGIIDGWEKDLTGLVSMIWTPLRYLTVTGSYEHLRRSQEISDTERENRYRVSAEVRY